MHEPCLFQLIDPFGQPMAQAEFLTYDDAVVGFGMTAYTMSQGWKVKRIDSDPPVAPI